MEREEYFKPASLEDNRGMLKKNNFQSNILCLAKQLCITVESRPFERCKSQIPHSSFIREVGKAAASLSPTAKPEEDDGHGKQALRWWREGQGREAAR